MKGIFSHLSVSELTVMFMIVILFVDLPAGVVVFVVHLFSLVDVVIIDPPPSHLEHLNKGETVKYNTSPTIAWPSH